MGISRVQSRSPDISGTPNCYHRWQLRILYNSIARKHWSGRSFELDETTKGPQKVEMNRARVRQAHGHGQNIAISLSRTGNAATSGERDCRSAGYWVSRGAFDDNLPNANHSNHQGRLSDGSEVRQTRVNSVSPAGHFTPSSLQTEFKSIGTCARPVACRSTASLERSTAPALDPNPNDRLPN
jgi:hypothetical protein